MSERSDEVPGEPLGEPPCGSEVPAGPDDEPRTALAEELRALGRGLRIPPVDGETVVERVLSQLLREHASAQRAADGEAGSGPAGSDTDGSDTGGSGGAGSGEVERREG